MEAENLHFENNTLKIDFSVQVQELEKMDLIKLDEMGFEILRTEPDDLELHIKIKGVIIEMIPDMVESCKCKIMDVLG